MATGEQQPRTNSTGVGKSIVAHPVDPEGLVYIHMGTGEIVLIPPGRDSVSFQYEYRDLNALVADYHAANRAVCTLSQYKEVSRHDADAHKSKDIDDALDKAYEWLDDAHDAYRKVFENLVLEKKENKPEEGGKEEEENSPLKGTGGQLIELASLDMEKKEAQEKAKKQADKAAAAQKKHKTRTRRGYYVAPPQAGAKEGGERREEKGELDGEGYTKTLLSKTGFKKLRDLGKLSGLDREKVVYVRQGAPDKKAKSGVLQKWPNMKVLDTTGWKDVFVTTGPKGRRKTTVDKAALKKYVAGKLKDKAGDKGMEWLKKKFGIDRLNEMLADRSGTVNIGDFWVCRMCEEWNEKLKYKNEWKLSAGGKPIADISLTANAQVMRYAYGASLNPQVDWKNHEISVRAEGHAELDVARAAAELTLNFPSAAGWLWTFNDNGRQKALAAIRVDVTVGVLGVVGASVAVELTASTTQKQISDPVGVKGSPGKKNRSQRRQKSAEIKQVGQNVQPVGLEANVDAFAGAKADGSIKGDLMWRDPESREKGFDKDSVIASITVEGGVMAGLAGAANFAVEYVHGMFHLTAHADLCFGVGAEGKVTFNVSTEQVEKFGKHVFYVFLNAKFQKEFKALGVLHDTGLKAMNAIKGLMTLNKGTTYRDYYGPKWQMDDLTREWNDQLASLDSPQLDAMADTVSNTLQCSLPETRGRILDAICNTALRDPTVASSAKRAALAVVKMAVIQPDLEASLQHVTSGGGAGSLEEGMAKLGALFSAGGGALADGLDGVDVSDEDRVALSGDFEGWYENHYSALAPEWPVGHPVVYRSVAGDDLYQMAAANNDHRLFSQEAWNPYYRTEEA